MMFKTAKDVQVRCPYGCGRYVLASRLADHALISAADHVGKQLEQSDAFKQAYAMLSRGFVLCDS